MSFSMQAESPSEPADGEGHIPFIALKTSDSVIVQKVKLWQDKFSSSGLEFGCPEFEDSAINEPAIGEFTGDELTSDVYCCETRDSTVEKKCWFNISADAFDLAHVLHGQGCELMCFCSG